MTVKVVPVDAYIFGTNVDIPIPCNIPVGISGKEIINLLIYQYSAQIQPDSVLLAKLPNADYVEYRIIDSKSDFSKCIDNRDMSLLVYPSKICLTINAPDGHSAFREYDSKKSVADIIASVCHSSFKLQTHHAYALYAKVNNGYVPMSNIKTIIEIDPFLTEVYLRRYFWLKPYIKTNREPDVHFTYAQAREYVYDRNFSYKNYKFIDLIAIDLIIKYQTYEQAKKALKKAKKKQVFPKYIYDSRKNIKNTTKQMKQYDKKPILDLKKTFIALCLQYQFFGLPMFPIKSNLPTGNSNEMKDYHLTADNEYLFILEPKAHIIVERIEITRISRYQMQNNAVQFTIVDKQKSANGHRNNVKWLVGFVNPVGFIQFFTNLVHFVKHETLQKQKKHEHKHQKHKKRRNTTLARSMSVSTFKSSSFNLADRDDMDMTDVDFHPTLELSSDLKKLNPITPPEQQNIVDSDVDFASIPTIDAITDESYLNRLISYIPEYDNQYGYSIPIEPKDEKPKLEEKESTEDDEKKDDELPPEVYLTDACNLVKKTVDEDALISETIVFIQSYLPRDTFKQSIIGWQLQCPSDSNFQRISCVSRAIIYFIYMNSTIAPLDLFSTINYIHSILLMYGKTHWSQVNYIEITKKIDYQLGLVAENYLMLTKRVSHPIASILLDCSLKLSDEYADLYLFTQTVYFALFVTCVTVARAFCNSGIASNLLQPILDTLPEVLVFDMGKMIEIAEPLYQIGRSFEKSEEVQKKFFAQPHFSNPQLKSIMSIINDIHNTSLIVQSPVFTFFSTFSCTLAALPENPTQTIVEAGDILGRVKHCSVVYWNVENCRLRSLSQEINWYAENFYSTFIYATQDSSLVSTCEVYYNKLMESWKLFISNLLETPLIEKILNGLDPSSLVIKNLISSTEKFEGTVALLCLLSVTTKNKKKAFDEAYATIDSKLVNDDLKMNALNNIYRIFSILSIDFNKDCPTQASELIELGNELLEVVIPETENGNENKNENEDKNKNEDKNEKEIEEEEEENENTNRKSKNASDFVVDERESEERRLKIKHCRDMLKHLYYIPEMPYIGLDVDSQEMPPVITINTRPSPGEMQIALVPMNEKPSLDILKKLASVLAQFIYDPFRS